MNKIFASILITSTVLITGCAHNGPSHHFPMERGHGAELLQSRTWMLTHIGSLEFHPDSNNQMPSLEFNQPTNRFSGSDGCNRIMGSYTLNGSNLQFGQVAGTQMLCHGNTAVTNGFNAALPRVTSFRASGHRLSLLDSQGSILLQFESTIQPR